MKLKHLILFCNICAEIKLMCLLLTSSTECVSHSMFLDFPFQLLYGWQSEQSGGLPKNSSIGHTDRADH